MNRKVLGKGLAALIPLKRGSEKEEHEGEALEGRVEVEEKERGQRIIYLKIDEIKSSKYQPRESFDEEKQLELAASIREKGVVQPILVRFVDGQYELVAGERRLRATRSLGIKNIPAIVKETSDPEALELSLIENLQREDLNPMEKAKSYQRLIEEFKFTQLQVAQAIGNDQSTVANFLRLLNLPQEVQKEIASGRITTGHAKAILSLKSQSSQIELCQRIIKNGLSVREAERLVSKRDRLAQKKEFITRDPQLVSMEEELQHIVGTKVRIIPSKKGGRLIIEYFSNEDLERILYILKMS